MASRLSGAPLEPSTHAVRGKAEHRADPDARQLSSLGRLVHPALRGAQVPRHGIDIPESVRVRNRRKICGIHLHSIGFVSADPNTTLLRNSTETLPLAAGQ